MKNKKAKILVQNVIFIILTIVFFTAAILSFIIISEPATKTAEKTAKQLALIIDSATPGTEIEINYENIFKIAEENNIKAPIQIDNEKNIITVQLDEKAIYQYSFFNNIQVSVGRAPPPRKKYLLIKTNE